MRSQMIARGFAVVLFSSILAACGGGGVSIGKGGGTTSSSGGSSSSGSGSSSSGSGSSGSSSGTTTVVAAHILVVSSSPTLAANAGTATSTVTVTATVTDANNVTIPNYPVSFSADGGVLTPSATVTDPSGNVTATLSAGSSTPGATIHVFATASPLSAASVAVKVASTTPSYALGSLSATGVFTAGTVAIGQTPLSAGGSSGLQVAIVDTANGNTPYTGNASVAFSSPCQSQSLASIASPVTGNTGTFSSSYKATGCSGNDTITASTVVNGSTISASGTINVQPASLGSVQFVSATPTTIGLKGTGLHESSTLVFTVLDSNGNPVQNQQVDFSLTTTAGGITVSPANAKSDASGNVQTTVQSGTVHTTVRVIATIHGTSLTTESSQLTVSTGLPTQNGFSLSATTHNLIGDNFDGNTATVTARLSDRYNNPVPDGTAVAFTTECGGIEPSCTTVNGACSVTFTTKNPRTSQLAFFPASSSSGGSPAYNANSCATNGDGANRDLGCDDHRCTVTAYALGEESFNDCNGTGLYVSKNNTSNNPTQCPNGDFFVSLPEVFTDYNESGIYNPLTSGTFETFIDFNKNGKWDAASNKFVGLLCTDPNCDPSQTTLNVSQSLIMVMSNSNLEVFVDTKKPAAPVPSNYVAPPTKTSLTIPLGGALTVYVTVGDVDALQAPAAGTVITASMSNGGSVLAPASRTVLDTTGFGYVTTQFTLQAPTTSKSGVDTLVISATSPPYGTNTAGVTSSVTIPVAYVAPTVLLSSTTLSFTADAGKPSQKQTVNVTNNGNTTLNISSVGISGANGGDFTTDSSSTCAGAQVAPGSSCMIVVYFTAPQGSSSGSSFSGTLFINSNAASSPDAVALSGKTN